MSEKEFYLYDVHPDTFPTFPSSFFLQNVLSRTDMSAKVELLANSLYFNRIFSNVFPICLVFDILCSDFLLKKGKKADEDIYI